MNQFLNNVEISLTVTGTIIAVCFWSLVIIDKAMGII